MIIKVDFEKMVKKSSSMIRVAPDTDLAGYPAK